MITQSKFLPAYKTYFRSLYRLNYVVGKKQHLFRIDCHYRQDNLFVLSDHIQDKERFSRHWMKVILFKNSRIFCAGNLSVSIRYLGECLDAGSCW